MCYMRSIFFIGVVIASVVLPWWLALPLFAYYAFVFRAYELIVLGILLDAYFGYMLPWHVFYTVAALALYMGMEFLKPRVAWYAGSS